MLINVPPFHAWKNHPISIQADPAKFEILKGKLFSIQKLEGNNSRIQLTDDIYELQSKCSSENVINE